MQIKEVASVTGIGAYAIRFYEKKGLIQVKRDTNGVRVFDELTLNRLRWIQCYRRAGLSIKDISRIIEADLSLEEFIGILDAAKDRLQTEIDNLKFTEGCLAIKRQAPLAGEPLTDVTVCAPTIYETAEH